MTAPTVNTGQALTPEPSVLDVIADWFPAFLGPTWAPWRAFLASVFALRVVDEPPLYQRCTGRQALPTTPAREVWTIVGRRGGKSRIAALLAVFLALFRRYQLAPGERGVVMVLAADRRQARVVMRYIVGLIDAVPALNAKISRRTAEALDFDNGLTIEIHTSSFRSVRGYTVVAAILDEIAYWPTDDSANPDGEVVTALRPAMATVPGALLLAISTPYARKGELWKAYRSHFGQDDDRVVVWQADTRTMNPTVPMDVIDQAYAEDDAVASAEYGAQFRRDVESFVSREAIDPAVVAGRLELSPVSTVRYWGFVDPSGGSQDAMTLAISHREDDRAVLDAVREVRPPFSPEAVVAAFTELLGRYQIATVRGDRYGGEWPREQFQKRGIVYEVSEASKSALYAELLPALNSGKVELLDHPRLLSQLAGLERRTTRSGKDSIDHAPGGHDDLINAAAGALLATTKPSVVWTADHLAEFVETNEALRRESPWI